MKRKLVWAGAGLLLLLFLLAGGLWIFRNRILNRVAKEKIARVEQRYGLEVHYDYLKFEGNGQLSLGGIVGCSGRSRYVADPSFGGVRPGLLATAEGQCRGARRVHGRPHG